MTGINMMGAYSGIDMSVIDQLVSAEKAKGVKFTNQKSKIEQQQNAWKDVNSRLDSFYKKLEALSKTETFKTHKVSSNVENSMALSVTAGEKAAEGQYRVHVEQLAESSRLTGTELKIDSIYTELGLTGTLGVSVVDGESVSVDIDVKDSLRSITDKINAKTGDTGIRASIVDNRLVLTNNNMGESTITATTDVQDVDGNQVNGLGLDAAVLSDGKAAIFTVDGIKITKDANTIDDVIEGLTFELTNVHTGTDSEVITIASDIEKTTAAVKDVVEQYNSLMSFLETQLDVGDPSADDNKTGALTGDGAVMRLQAGLRSLMTTNIKGDFSGDIKNVKDLGISVDRYGMATLDEAALSDALKEDPANVAKFFFNQSIESVDVENDAGDTVQENRIKREGFSHLLQNFVDTYISSSSGIITNKNTNYDKMIKDLNKQIQSFNERVERKRDRYIKQFTALDTSMMQAQSQLDYLYSQLGVAQPAK